jgi:hypothetical protein
MIAAHAALVLRSGSARTAFLAAGHALVVGAVAWYVVEAAWGSTPISASFTPVSSVAFLIAWAAGTVYLLLVAPVVGAASVKGPWVGSDPTACLSVSIASRAAAAWAASVLVLSVVATAPIPVYLALEALGALSAEAGTGYVIVQAAIVLAAPLPGIAMALRLTRTRGR